MINQEGSHDVWISANFIYAGAGNKCNGSERKIEVVGESPSWFTDVGNNISKFQLNGSLMTSADVGEYALRRTLYDTIEDFELYLCELQGD